MISDPRGRGEIDCLLNYSIQSEKMVEMIEIGQFTDVELISSSPFVDHFIFNRSVKSSIQAALGFSQGQVIDRLGAILLRIISRILALSLMVSRALRFNPVVRF